MEYLVLKKMMRMKITVRNKVMLCIGMILILVSLIIMGKYLIRIKQRKIVIEQKEKKFIQSVSSSHVNFRKKTDGMKPPKVIDNLIGFIEIDKIHIKLPIYTNTSKKSLREGVGILEGTDLPMKINNTLCVIAGHRGGYYGDKTFLKIDELQKGDTVKVTTSNPEIFYKVLRKEVVESDDWSRFQKDESKALLILMTCHPYPKNNKRLLVICEAIKDI